MLPKWHIILGATFSLLLVLSGLIPFKGGIVVFLASFLIDFDYYLWYVVVKKDWNPFRAIKWSHKLIEKGRKIGMKKVYSKYRTPVRIFHSVLLIFFLGILWIYVGPLFFWIMIGFIFHLFLDYVAALMEKVTIYDKVFPLFYMYFGLKKKRIDFV